MIIFLPIKTSGQNTSSEYLVYIFGTSRKFSTEQTIEKKVSHIFFQNILNQLQFKYKNGVQTVSKKEELLFVD